MCELNDVHQKEKTQHEFREVIKVLSLRRNLQRIKFPPVVDPVSRRVCHLEVIGGQRHQEG